MRLFCMVGLLIPSVFAADPDQVAQGKYLVEEVAKCQICHTPKLESGELDRAKWMKGATLDIQPTAPVKGWHTTTPDITPKGRLWGRWGEAAILKYLETGLDPKGKASGPPMPAYTLKPADAEAVLEYLKTLK